MFRTTLLILTIGALLATSTTASAQVAAGAAPRAPRIRTYNLSGDSARARRERLLMRFDSLRFEFDQSDEAGRVRLANQMHQTFMAIQASFSDEAMVRAGAEVAASTAPTVIARRRGGPGFGAAIAMTMFCNTRGFLGVSFDGPSTEECRDGERYIRFLDYPKIALVEPSSPAERAGIQQGDTLLALGGRDVVDHEFSLTRLLVPDQTIWVRVRREGNAKDVRVKIERTPGYVVKRMEPMATMPAMPVDVAPMRVEMPRAVPMPPTTPRVSVWTFDNESSIGGARFENIGEGLGRALGTQSGVLVLRAVPGSRVWQSGVRDGDVILRVAGDNISNTRALREKLLEGDREDGVKVIVLRERKQRELTLRW